jgi:hypothetical protein
MHAALLLPPPTHCSPTHCAPIIVLSLNALSGGQGRPRARYQRGSHSPVRSHSTQLRQNQKSERSCQCEKEDKKEGEGVTRHDGNATQLTGRRRCSVRRMISHQLLPAHVIRCSRPLDRPRRCLHNTSQEKETADKKGGTHLVLHCAAVSFSVPQLFLLCRMRFDLPSCLEASASCTTTNFEARI